MSSLSWILIHMCFLFLSSVVFAHRHFRQEFAIRQLLLLPTCQVAIQVELQNVEKKALQV